MGKLKKTLKKVGKAAAVAGAAYAASKMMSPKNSKIGIGSDAVASGIKEPAKKSFLEKMGSGLERVGIGKNPNAATYQPYPGQVDEILNMGVGGAKKGTFVTVKTKMGRNKKTRIC
jgi:hypothetical protein